VLLTSALGGGEWSDSRPGRFTPRERPPGTHWIGSWVNPRAGVDDVEKRKFLTLPGLEIRPLGRPERGQSLYRLRYSGSEHRVVSRKSSIAARFMLVSCSAYSSSLKMEATRSSETSNGFRRTTRSYIPEIGLFVTTFVTTSSLTYLHRTLPP
jgi:hypothetical protein